MSEKRKKKRKEQKKRKRKEKGKKSFEEHVVCESTKCEIWSSGCCPLPGHQNCCLSLQRRAINRNKRNNIIRFVTRPNPFPSPFGDVFDLKMCLNCLICPAVWALHLCPIQLCCHRSRTDLGLVVEVWRQHWAALRLSSQPLGGLPEA